MRHVLRRIFICALTVAFVFSGAAWQTHIELPAAQAAPIVAAHDLQHDRQHGPMAAADHHHGGQVAPVATSGQNPSIDHDCLKCCGVCTVVSPMPNPSASLVNFSGTLIAFRVGRHDLTGHVEALDPGIPKRIV